MSDIIQDILPAGEVSILAGASGVGKTTLIMQILAKMQANAAVFQHRVAPNVRIGYIAADRSWDSYKKTASAADLNLKNIGVRTLIDDESIDLTSFKRNPIETLKGLIRSLQPLDLVVVDPLVVFLGVDTNKYHLNAAALIELNRFCKREHVTILGTHHATKARSDYTFKRPQDRISGTSALLGFTSTQLFIASPEETGRDDGVYEWYVISHHAAGRVVELHRNERGVFEFHQEKLLSENMSLADHITEFVSQPFEGTPGANRVDIVERFNQVSSATVDRTLRRLVREGILRSSLGRYRLVSN